MADKALRDERARRSPPLPETPLQSPSTSPLRRPSPTSSSSEEDKSTNGNGGGDGGD